MTATFSLSRANKLQLQQRVVELTRLCNEMGRELNSITDAQVIFVADRDIRAGESIPVRVPRRYRVRNT